MRDLKQVLILIVFTLITYWGVEPFAHSQMHKHTEDADYSFSDLTAVSGGSAEAGAELVTTNCIACHSITSQGYEPPMPNADAAAAYGVVPPDLSTAGLIYDAKYLSSFVKNPAKASKVEHKFPADGTKLHPMPSYDWMSDGEIDSIVKYLQSIAPKELSNKEVFVEACSRCHSLAYGDMMNHSMMAKTPEEFIKPYMGSTPPDLSQYIRSRQAEYIHKFVNDPQKMLPGTAMPRVGLTEKAEQQVVAYLTEVGDPSKEKRDALGIYVILYLVVFTFFAWLWKNKIWSKLH